MTDPARSTVRAGSGCVMSYRTSRARALPPAIRSPGAGAMVESSYGYPSVLLPKGF